MDALIAGDRWAAYGRHAELILSTGPAPQVDRSDDWFLALSGAGHVDLNQAAMFGSADPGTAMNLGAMIVGAGVPCLVGVSASLPTGAGSALASLGFTRSREREALFHASVPPPVSNAGFDVRRVTTEADDAALQGTFADAHGYDPDLVRRMYGGPLLERDDVGAWLAWDRETPVSCVFITQAAGSLGVFHMQTPPAHRRRGGGRTVLTEALSDAMSWADSSDGIILWSSPAGRALYESLGFVVADHVDAWTIGASTEDLAAVGAE